MAHFAKLNDINRVVTITCVDNSHLYDINNPESGVESEARGIDFLQRLYNEPEARWVQTSYNGNFRKNYAGVDFLYDEERDAFIPPKPYNSWTLDEETCRWVPPTPRPDEADRSFHVWDEESLSWKKQVWDADAGAWVNAE